jgi:1-phosphofructokinase family hexose kinase
VALIVTVTPNPVLDRTLTVPRIVFNEVMRATASRLDWGGKGFNVSRALCALGVESVAMGFVGGVTGQRLVRGLRDLGIVTDLVTVAGDTRTNIVITDGEGERYLKVNEAGPTVQAEEWGAFLDRVRERVRPGEIWVLSGSLSPGLPSDFYAQLIGLVQERGAKAVLDASGEPLRLACATGPYLVKPNAVEAEEMTGRRISSDADVLSAAAFFLDQRVELVALSLGGDGLLLASRLQAVWARPPRAQARNPVGAGDASLAGIAWALERGLPLEEIARWGVAAGTAAAMREGVSVGTRDEVEALYKHIGTEVVEKKGLWMPGAARHSAEWPPPLMTSELGSFARRTILERKPQIIRQVMENNGYPPDIRQALKAFREEIAAQPMRPLSEQAPDVAFWNQALVTYRDETWLDVPWYFAETFFYRRLLETVRYFQPGPWERHDPFAKQKREQEEVAVERLAKSWAQLNAVEPKVAFEALLHSCLWGNRADLSNFTVGVQAEGGLMAREERHNILIDHTERVWEMMASGLERVDFLSDNVGLDLLFDLALTDWVISRGWVGEVVLHLKDRPFFVSDAMAKDVGDTLVLLRAAVDIAVQELGARLQDHLDAGRLKMKEDPFWTSCYTFEQLPLSLRAELARSELVILKGDVNYRRLLGDRHWPHTMRMEQIAAYFPVPFLVLRTLKGEIMVGLDPGRAEALAAEDPTWLINGKRGVIQLVTEPGPVGLAM